MTIRRYSPFHTLIQRLASSSAGSWFLSRALPPLDRLWLRASGGRSILTSLLAGVPVVMVTTTGAKSGKPRSAPLLPIRDQANPAAFAVIASNWGQHRYPAWYFNLRAHPHAMCVVGGRGGWYEAHEATGEEYERFWNYATGTYLGYTMYRQRAGRRIPIMVMVPTD